MAEEFGSQMDPNWAEQINKQLQLQNMYKTNTPVVQQIVQHLLNTPQRMGGAMGEMTDLLHGMGQAAQSGWVGFETPNYPHGYERSEMYPVPNLLRLLMLDTAGFGQKYRKGV